MKKLIVFLLLCVFAFSGQAQAVEVPRIVQSILDNHVFFYEHFRGYNEYRLYDVRVINRDLIGIVMYNRAAIRITKVFERHTGRLVERVDSRIEPREVRQQRMASTISVPDAMNIIRAVRQRQEEERTVFIWNSEQ